MSANKNSLTQPIFDLGLCSLHENGVEFFPKCNGNVLVSYAGKTEALLRYFPCREIQIQNWDMWKQCPIFKYKLKHKGKFH